MACFICQVIMPNVTGFVEAKKLWCPMPGKLSLLVLSYQIEFKESGQLKDSIILLIVTFQLKSRGGRK
jgi:hypothetical protein